MAEARSIQSRIERASVPLLAMTFAGRGPAGGNLQVGYC